MVPREPDLGDIGESAVVGDVLHRQMAVKIVDGQVLGVPMVKGAGGSAEEEEALIQEASHRRPPVLS
jgi:hypothetical protein